MHLKNIFIAGIAVLILSLTQVSAFAKSDDATPVDAVLMLEDGEQITGGTYTAESENQSACEADRDVTATISGTVLQKLSGDASSADAASFRGINS